MAINVNSLMRKLNSASVHWTPPKTRANKVKHLSAPFQREPKNNFEMSKLHAKRAKAHYLRSHGNKCLRPKNFYKSYSTASDLVPNMLSKTEMINLMVADHILNHDFTKSKIASFKECGKNITFAMGRDKNTGYKHHHIMKGYFCDFKYCPIRQHINAKKRVNRINTELKWLYDKKNWLPIFITFTIKDVSKPTAYKIKKTFKAMNKAWNRMSKYKLYNGDNRFIKSHKGILKGWISKPEHTYKSKKNMVNLHLHIIGIVRKSYLNKYGSKYWITKAQWKKDWTRSAKLDYTPVISIEVPYYKNEFGDKVKITECHSKEARQKCLYKASVEISKYTGKSVNYSKEPRLYGKISRKKISKWSKRVYGCTLTSAGWFNQKYIIKEYLLNNLSKEQINSVNAFHAIYKGLKGAKVLRFGGWCQWANRLYNKGALKKYQNLPKVVYSYKINSIFRFDYKDYLDTKLNLTKQDVKDLESEKLEVNAKDINTGKALFKKSAYQIMKNTPNSLVREWFKDNVTDKLKWWKSIVNQASYEVLAK